MGPLSSPTTRDWERTFTRWAKPPGQTEADRQDHALTAIRKAVAKSDALGSRDLSTFAQGSFANRTTVRLESDVDVCILCSNTFYFDLPDGFTRQDAGITPATYSYDEFKGDVSDALFSHFGEANASPGNKAFYIHENTYRVDADAVACFDFRQYYVGSYGKLEYHTGTSLLTGRESRLLTNFPQQQYDNGVAKNEETGRRFKALVRIVKNLRDEMLEVDFAEAEPIASFLIESLVWNWPSEAFNRQTSFTSMVDEFLAWVCASTQTDLECALWLEENGIKPLFGASSSWTREQVNSFASAAYGYIRNQ